jgi:hypothetical protein
LCSINCLQPCFYVNFSILNDLQCCFYVNCTFYMACGTFSDCCTVDLLRNSTSVKRGRRPRAETNHSTISYLCTRCTKGGGGYQKIFDQPLQTIAQMQTHTEQTASGWMEIAMLVATDRTTTIIICFAEAIAEAVCIYLR